MPLSPAGETRKQFALSGRSAKLDPRRHAVRPDLADVRLAEFVFAPRYASPVTRHLLRAAPLRGSRGADAEVLMIVQPGDTFELLDVVGEDGWGVAVAAGLVGYVDIAALLPA